MTQQTIPATCFFLGGLALIPGLFLLNQELGLIPFTTGVYDITLNGRIIPNVAAAATFLGISGVLLTCGTILLVHRRRDA